MGKHFKSLVFPFLLALILLLFFTERSASGSGLLLICALFALYVGIAFSPKSKTHFKWFLGVGILARLLAVFAWPELSDDMYRFIWDGRLMVSGINPFEATPSAFCGAGDCPSFLGADLYEKLNSKAYFTIYPAVSQAIYAAAVWLFPNSIYGAGITMKGCLFLFELGTLYTLYRLLLRFQLPRERLLWYALNPLVIIEICGNAHFEGVLLFFFFMSIYLLIEQKKGWAGLFFAFSVAAKLLSILFLPFLIRLQKRPSLSAFFLATALGLALLFYPILHGVFLSNFGESLDLYFRKFEYNGSLYYIARWIGTHFQGYNPIAYTGPIMRILSALLILCVFIWKKQGTWLDFFEASLYSILIYLLFATTVHPWYAILPLGLCLFTKWRFPIYWSWAIMLTYINYGYPVFYENLWIVAFEYLSLLAFYYVVDVKQFAWFSGAMLPKQDQ